MAHESFEDEEVSEILNRDFICIKVDREERPDIDAVYMSVCQMLTGSGGWPLTILMTPEQKPFWAGTYLPKYARYGRMGLMDLLENVAGQWKSNCKNMLAAGEEIVRLIQPKGKKNSVFEPTKEMVLQAVTLFESSYDPKWGGFGQAPKFPTPYNLIFLLRYAALENHESAQEMAEYTLRQMYRGGIFDHIGGGFSRYSTDEKWLVPHFEKMLYDNALLVDAYLEAYHMTGDSFYRSVIKRVLYYVKLELTDDLGGFYCGQDADSEGMEGKFYVFTTGELEEVLGKEKARIVCEWYGISTQGNFDGKNILNLLHNENYEVENEEISLLCKLLYEYRLFRTTLHKDDKILTSWNALMIAAFAKAGWLLEDEKYLQTAIKAERFLSTYVTDKKGRLLLRWCGGEAAHAGQLDDYAFYAFALLELYRATFEVSYLKKSIRIAEHMLDFFWDKGEGGFYLYAKDSEQLISRPKEVYDGAIPSGNGIAAQVLVTLSRLTGELKWQQYSEKQIQYVSRALAEYPAGFSASLMAILAVLYPTKELVCVLSDTASKTEVMHHLKEKKNTNVSVILKNRENSEDLCKIAPFTRDYPIPEIGVLYYVCQDGTCKSPTTNLPF